MIHIRRLLGITALAFVTTLTTVVHADENNDAGYSITPVTSEYQRVKASYYDLRLAPAQQTTVQVKIDNKSSETSTFDVSVNTTSTSKYMTYLYTEPQNTTTLVPKALQFSSLTPNAKQTVTIPGNTVQVVDVPLTMPVEPFDGTLYGALSVVRHIRDDERKKDGITNQYGYVKAILVSENDTIPDPKLVFGAPTSDTQAGSLQLHIPITYSAATILSSLTTHLVITDSHDKVVVDTKSDNHNIAPQSKFTYTADLDSSKFKSGTYHAALTIESEKGRQWTMKKQSFTVKKKDVQAAKKHEKTLQKSFTINPWYVILGLLAIVLILILLLFKKRKND